MKNRCFFSFKKRFCNICGKKGRVLILFGIILSRWGYWGTVYSNDYWECPKCVKGKKE